MGGIVFNSGSSGTISYANISNASCGIKCNGEDDVTINNCNISDCYMGVYSINTNSIFDKPVVSNTEVTNCMNGIVAQFSHPDINNTDITSGYLAFYGYNSQSNFLNGYNGIYGNDAGIQAIASNLKLGNSTTWGNNRLGLNDAANFNLSASSYSYIDAIGNYWGASSPTGITIESGSTVNYTPYLSSDPTGAMLNIGSPKSLNPAISYSILPGDETGDLPVKYASAKQLLSEKKYPEAYAITREIIDNYPNEKEAYYSIYIIDELLSKAPYLNINNYILSKSSSVDMKNINGVLELLLVNYEKEGKKTKYKILKTKYSDFPVLEHVLYQNFLYYIHEEKDTEEAEKLLKQLEKEFTDSKMLTMARMELSIATNQIPFLAEENSQSESINKKIESNVGVELTGNYPNPFNPTTIIKYQLPSAGLVTLKVYDILGKEITTLVNEHKVAGLHSIEFNASNLPSGIYIYTINSNGFIQSKKMILTK